MCVCLFVCQDDNFCTSKHSMMKLESRCIVQNSRLSSNLGVLAPWVRTPKNVALGYDVGKISAGCLVLLSGFTVQCIQKYPVANRVIFYFCLASSLTVCRSHRHSQKCPWKLRNQLEWSAMFRTATAVTSPWWWWGWQKVNKSEKHTWRWTNDIHWRGTMNT